MVLTCCSFLFGQNNFVHSFQRRKRFWEFSDKTVFSPSNHPQPLPQRWKSLFFGLVLPSTVLWERETLILRIFGLFFKRCVEVVLDGLGPPVMVIGWYTYNFWQVYIPNNFFFRLYPGRRCKFRCNTCLIFTVCHDRCDMVHGQGRWLAQDARGVWRTLRGTLFDAPNRMAVLKPCVS